MKKLILAAWVFLASSLAHSQEPPSRVSVDTKALEMILSAYCNGLVESVAAKASSISKEDMPKYKEVAMKSCLEYMVVGLKPVVLTGI